MSTWGWWGLSSNLNKALAILLTWWRELLIYQGKKSMTNYPFKSLEDVEDIESINYAHEALGKRGFRLKWSWIKSAILVGTMPTPMQWNDEAEAGFTTGHPWLGSQPKLQRDQCEAAQQIQTLFSYHKPSLFEKEYPWLVTCRLWILVDCRQRFFGLLLGRRRASLFGGCHPPVKSKS